MSKHSRIILLSLLIGVAINVMGQGTVSYKIVSYTIESANVSSGGGLRVYGITGQADGLHIAQGGNLRLLGGFIVPVDTDIIFENGFE